MIVMIKRLLAKLGFKKNEIPRYGLLYFDHLQGEVALVKDSIKKESEKAILSAIEEKRKNKTLTWNDIYTYQLILLEYQDFETLKSKIISLRIKFQSLVDIAEYNSYNTNRMVDLSQMTTADIDKLRADFKYLLDEFYLRYAYVSTREELRNKLLRYGALLTFICFLLAVTVGTLAGFTRNATMIYLRDTFSIVFIVAFAGIIGAFVSMQQRLQSLSGQGDPIHNLSLLTHGWFSIFLSPMSGAIFAVILYLFFAGGLLKGTIFPEMITSQKPEMLINIIDKKPAVENPNPANTDSSNSNNDASTPSTQTIEDTQEPVLGLTNFLAETGAQTGTSFALLLIWSFIAGFAERFVPDTLMRLVSQKKAGESPPA
jgi:hypothetical protein